MPEINLEITSLAQDGRGIGRCRDAARPDWENMAVFARGALPGQTVLVRIDKVKNNFAEGEAIAVLEGISGFIRAFCPNFGRCGGCPLQIMPYKQQLEWKSRLAREALLRQGRMDAGLVEAVFSPPCPSPNLQACRNKMEFAFGEDADGSLIVGLRRSGSHQVVGIDFCPLLPEGHREILQETVREVQNSGLSAWKAGRGSEKAGCGFWRHLVLRHGTAGGQNVWLALCITSPGRNFERKIVRSLGESLLAKVPNLVGFVHEERRANDFWRHCSKRIAVLGQATIFQQIGGREFELDAASFSQVNPAAANQLAKLVCEMANGPEGGDILDLYCGIGAPGQLLAGHFAKLVGVDSQKNSIALASKNAANLPNCSYKLADAEDFLRKNRRRWQTILVDPPRSGLGGKAIKNIFASRPEQIIHISCNPVTFARDAALLNEVYELRRMASVDLFPHTPHLECCSQWLLRHEC